MIKIDIPKFSNGIDSQISTTMATLLPPVNATGPCDRRLSRAARQVLEEQLVPLLEHWLEETGQKLPQLPTTKLIDHNKPPRLPTTLAPTYLWDLLELTASAASCPLHPSRDVHHHVEMHSMMAEARAPKLAPRNTYGQWFHCGICGKVFGTRYYLDRHQHLQHGESSKENEKACLATAVCDALGGCDRMATVDLEPYYGLGSGGPQGDHALSIQRAWAARDMEPCDETKVQSQMKPACRKLMQDCFSSSQSAGSSSKSLQKQLEESLCEPLSCHTLLHRQEWMHRHLAKGLFRQQLELQNIHSSTGVILVVVFLILYYLIVVIGCTERGSHGGSGSNRSGRQLSSSRNESPWRSLLGRKKPKKKSL